MTNMGHHIEVHRLFCLILVLIFLLDCDPDLSFWPCPIVIERRRKYPEQITIDLQRSSIFVIDEDTYWQALYLFWFEHLSKSFLNVRPDKERARVINLNFFNFVTCLLSKFFDGNLIKFANLLFILFEFFDAIYFRNCEQFQEKSIVIVSICKNRKLLSCRNSLLSI